MENSLVIARPYAKAIFEIALHHGKLREWSQILSALSKVVNKEQTRVFLKDPRIDWQDKLSIFLQAGEKIFDQAEISFIKILAANKRLEFLPQIKLLFDNEVNDYKNIVSVTVFTASKLSDELHSYIESKLEKYFNKEIVVNYELDQSLIGGILIKAGDKVIDGSVLGKLNRLQRHLL